MRLKVNEANGVICSISDTVRVIPVNLKVVLDEVEDEE